LLRHTVFEQKKIGLRELADVLADNFRGREPLRRMLLNKVPKFGNDLPYVDDLAVRIMEDCYETVMKKSRERDMGKMRICCGIGTFENYARFGHNIGATPDGRLARESISSNFSPSLGVDVNGPTSAIKSITKVELFKFVTGCPLDLQIDSNDVEGEAGIGRIAGLIRAFRELGGLLLTITGVGEDMLIAAQKEPEKHKGLRVRLGGLSAYFIALSKDQQDIMIKRVKHRV
jgi:formate C-acetyltransferase